MRNSHINFFLYFFFKNIEFSIKKSNTNINILFDEINKYGNTIIKLT